VGQWAFERLYDCGSEKLGGEYFQDIGSRGHRLHSLCNGHNACHYGYPVPVAEFNYSLVKAGAYHERGARHHGDPCGLGVKHCARSHKKGLSVILFAEPFDNLLRSRNGKGNFYGVNSALYASLCYFKSLLLALGSDHCHNALVADSL